MTRPSVPEWGLRFEEVVATRSTCLRRAVGCVLLDRRGNILATGHNGVPSGSPHCNERVLDPGVPFGDTGMAARKVTWPHACPGASLPSGEGLDLCEAIHAEQNCVMTCHAVGRIWMACATTSPCMTSTVGSCPRVTSSSTCSRRRRSG